ncbi:MAG: enoyl-CoA hydratase-related protein, partial [Pseudomonadota bacterium]
MAYECILTEVTGNVGILTLHRPDALNAFNLQLMDEVTAALKAFEADDGVGCIIITGSDKAFAAGADIKEMQDKEY